MNKKTDLLKQQFGKLEVLSYGKNNNWICKCNCGYSNKIVVRRTDLLNGVIKDCGCGEMTGIQDQKFGKLKVIKLDRIVNRQRRWVCDCDCGNKGISIAESVLIHWQKLTCGHCKHTDLAGKTFGNLKVIKAINKTMWQCECLCGSNKEVLVPAWALRSGDINNCGCGERLLIDANNYNPYKYEDNNTIAIYAINTGTKFYIDVENYEKVELYRWTEAQGGYLWARLENGSVINMHYAILGIKDKNAVEIIYNDNDRKNLRKSNLTVIDRKYNLGNRNLRSNNRTGHVGVSMYGKYNYRAQIMVNGINKVLGVRSNYEDAVKLREAAEEEYFGRKQ